MSHGGRPRNRGGERQRERERLKAATKTKSDAATADLAKAAAEPLAETEPRPVQVPSRIRRGWRYLAAHKGAATALFVSVCTLFVTVYQGYVGREGLDQQTAATNAQVKTFELQMRPWLNATDFEAPKLDGTPQDMARFEIHNVGQLPAFGTYTGCIAAITKASLADHQPTVKELCANGAMVPEKFTLFAVGASQTTYPGIPMRGYDAQGRAQDVAAILGPVNSGASSLFVCMRFEFTGPDRHEHPHHTYWSCVMYEPDRKTWVQHIPPEVDGEVP